MNVRTVAVGTALAIFGLGAAVGIGLAANSISGDSVGLSEEPLSAGGTLAPRPATAGDDGRRQARARRRAAPRRPPPCPSSTATAPARDAAGGEAAAEAGRAATPARATARGRAAAATTESRIQ